MWPYPRIVAHRGGGKLAPENTLAAMRCGLQHGFRAVEFDVMLSSDEVPIVMHDPQRGRTVAGRGSIADFTAAELTVLDAGSWFGPQFAGECVPTYREVFDYCQANRIWMNVEIKPVPGFEERTGQVVAELTQQWLNESDGIFIPPLFSSFSLAALMAAKIAAPGIARGFLVETIPSDWQLRLRELEAVALHTNHRHLTPQLAVAIKEAGYGLFCYTVNEVERARELLSWGVDGFCTDRIDVIAADMA